VTQLVKGACKVLDAAAVQEEPNTDAEMRRGGECSEPDLDEGLQSEKQASNSPTPLAYP
jgi:hypothetical protein